MNAIAPILGSGLDSFIAYSSPRGITDRVFLVVGRQLRVEVLEVDGHVGPSLRDVPLPVTEARHREDVVEELAEVGQALRMGGEGGEPVDLGRLWPQLVERPGERLRRRRQHLGEWL